MIEDVVRERCARAMGREDKEKVVTLLSLRDLCKLRNIFVVLFLLV